MGTKGEPRGTAARVHNASRFKSKEGERVCVCGSDLSERVSDKGQSSLGFRLSLSVWCVSQGSGPTSGRQVSLCCSAIRSAVPSYVVLRQRGRVGCAHGAV